MLRGYAPNSLILLLGPSFDRYPALYSSRPDIIIIVKNDVVFGLNIPEIKTKGNSHERCSILLP